VEAGIGGHDQLMVHGRVRASSVKKGCKKGMQVHPFFDIGRRPGVPGCTKAC